VCVCVCVCVCVWFLWPKLRLVSLGSSPFCWSFYIITDIMNTSHALKFEQLADYKGRLEYIKQLNWNMITWQFRNNTFFTVGTIKHIRHSDVLIVFTTQCFDACSEIKLWKAAEIKRNFSELYIFRIIFFLRCFYSEKFCFLPNCLDWLFSLESFSFQTKGIIKNGKQLGCQKNDEIHKQGHLKLICYIIKYSVSLC
jgi:hypothetical protein